MLLANYTTGNLTEIGVVKAPKKVFHVPDSDKK